MTDSTPTTAAHFQEPTSRRLTWNDARVTFTPTGESARVGHISSAPIVLQSSPQPRKRRWWKR